MRRFLPAAFLLLIGFLAMPAAASAQQYNQRITVYAVVLEQRVIYLDESGNIIKIAGNTAKNISPSVLDSNNQAVPMTTKVQNQYDNFLAQHGGHLQASKIYNLNPLSVNLSSNTQVIVVGNGNLSLSKLKVE